MLKNIRTAKNIISNTTFDVDGGGIGVFTLISNSSGDASIAQLPAGASIIDSLTVQRFLPNATSDRDWRYVGSPSNGGIVSDWKNEIPITGTFNDPSTQAEWPGIPGIVENSPSMYRYNETLTAGDENTRWESYPVDGTNSSAATLTSG